MIVGDSITYENGADVPTSFVTSLGEYIVETAPELGEELGRLNRLNVKATKKTLRKVRLPDEVVTAGNLRYLANHGIKFALRREDVYWRHDLDNYNVFGGCYLLSERAAAERAAAEQIELSEREKQTVRMLTERSERQ